MRRFPSLHTLVSNERVEFPEGVTVYNFTVDGNHNYFVIAETDEFGQTCILVHNADYGKPDKLPKLFNTLKIPFNIPGGSIQIGIGYEISDDLKETANNLKDPSRWSRGKFSKFFEELPQGLSLPGAEIKAEVSMPNGIIIFGGYGTTYNGEERQRWFGLGRRW